MKASYRLAITYIFSALLLFSIQLYANDGTLETVIVIGKNKQPNSTSGTTGSIDLLSIEELSYEHVDDTLELFNKVPGIYLSRYNQGVINTDIAIRGFAGDGSTPHAKMLIDGIPSNLHQGYNEIDQLFPLHIASINAFKGTSDPRYGLFNIAGNYNISTRQDEAQEVELTLDSFNAREIQGYAGFSSLRFNQSYTMGYRTSEGYRDHTDLTKYTLGGKWGWLFAEDKQLKIITRHASYDGDAPGYLSLKESKENPKQSAIYANQDGGDKTTNHLSLHWNQNIDNMQWQLKAYSQTFERERWVRFSSEGTLQNRYDDQKQLGLISYLNMPLTSAWEIDWGLNYETQDIVEQRFGTLGQVRLRDTSTVIRNYDYSFSQLGYFAKLSHEPSSTLRWNIAIRADKLDGNFYDVNNSEHREIFNFGTILQPKFNIVYVLFEPLNIFANAGRSYQHPFGKSAYTISDRNARKISLNDGWEMGSQWSPQDKLNIRVSYWLQTANDEYVVVDGTSQNVGKTKRSGFDIAFNGSLTNRWLYWGNFATIHSEIIKGEDSEFQTTGNELRSIPSYTASLGMSFQATHNFITRVHIDSQGDYYVNEANEGGKFGDYILLSASADYNLYWGSIKVQLNNLTNEYYEYVYDFSSRGTATIHSPGDGINGSFSVHWNL